MVSLVDSGVRDAEMKSVVPMRDSQTGCGRLTLRATRDEDPRVALDHIVTSVGSNVVRMKRDPLAEGHW